MNRLPVLAVALVALIAAPPASALYYAGGRAHLVRGDHYTYFCPGTVSAFAAHAFHAGDRLELAGGSPTDATFSDYHGDDVEVFATTPGVGTNLSFWNIGFGTVGVDDYCPPAKHRRPAAVGSARNPTRRTT